MMHVALPTRLLLPVQVARFNFSRKLLFAANADASMVAWTDGGSLHIAFRETGAVHTLWQPAAPPGRGQQHHCLLRPPWVDRGFVLALHWSPDGRRLLFLLHAGPPREPGCVAGGACELHPPAFWWRTAG